MPFYPLPLNLSTVSNSEDITSKITDKEAEGGVESGDIIVFNSLSWEVRNWVEMELNFKEGEIEAIKGLKSGKEEIDVEVIKFARYEDDSVKYAKI